MSRGSCAKPSLFVCPLATPVGFAESSSSERAPKQTNIPSLHFAKRCRFCQIVYFRVLLFVAFISYINRCNNIPKSSSYQVQYEYIQEYRTTINISEQRGRERELHGGNRLVKHNSPREKEREAEKETWGECLAFSATGERIAAQERRCFFQHEQCSSSTNRSSSTAESIVLANCDSTRQTNLCVCIYTLLCVRSEQVRMAVRMIELEKYSSSFDFLPRSASMPPLGV